MAFGVTTAGFLKTEKTKTDNYVFSMGIFQAKK